MPRSNELVVWDSGFRSRVPPVAGRGGCGAVGRGDPAAVAGLEGGAAFEGAAEGEFVGVFEVAADGEA